MAVLLVILVLLQSWWKVGSSRRLLLGAGLLLGALPFVHVHTFIVGMLIVGIAVIVFGLQGQWSRVQELLRWTMLPAVLVALPQLYWQISGSLSSGFVQQSFGWLNPAGGNLAVFWLRNLGALLVVAPLAFAAYKKIKGQPLLWILTGVGLLLFFACNLFSFQPNLWDNMKLLTYADAFVLLPVALGLAWLTRRWYGWLVALPIFLSLTLAGGITIYRELNLSYEVLNSQEVAVGNLVDALVPADAIVATSQRHNHPVTLVAGRAIPFGYPGWLWSYGVDYNVVALEMNRFWRGDLSGEQAYQTLGVSYAVINYQEFGELNVNLEYFNAHYRLLAEQDGWRIYQLRP